MDSTAHGIEDTEGKVDISFKNQHREEAGSILIEPSSGWRFPNLRELWSNHELLYFMVWRDIKARYKQTKFGIAWAVIQPLTTTIVFTVVFGYFVGISTGEIPYPLFILAAMVPWTYFARSFERASNSVVDSAHLVTKVYFPRMVFPVGGVVSGLVDFSAALVVLFGAFLVFGVAPSARIVVLPVFVLLAMITALGAGLWASAINVYYRDVKHVMPFIIMIWMYATPVIYPINMVPEQLRVLYGLNPMVSVVQGFRWALFADSQALDMTAGISSLVAIGLLVSGALYFRRMEDSFADVI